MSASYCVFDYSNYRSFLRVSYEAKKRENPLWSYQVWANKIGLSSGTTLSKILQGHRDPGPTATSRLCDYFGFDDEEREYFEDLVKLHKVQNDPRLSLVIVKRLNRRSKGESNIRILSQDEFEMISKWWFYGIRQLSRVVELKNDPEWISERLRFPVSPKQVKAAVDLMLQHGLLMVDERGILQLDDFGLDTKSDVGSEALKCYHEGIVRVAAEAVRQVPRDQRYFRAKTLSVSKKDLPRMKEAVENFFQQFQATFDVNDGDEVYQFQSQLFPLTNLSGDSDGTF